MTKKLYYEDVYLNEWQSEIKDIIHEKDKFLIVLDRTAFFPEGGGQPADKGCIDDIEVIDVFEKDNIIYHVVEKIPENKIVKCKLNFDRRFYYMQQHSGEHLLSAVLYKMYNTNNDGFHMGDDYITIDNSIINMTEDMVKAVEVMANKYIYKDLPILSYFVENEDLEELKLRKECKVEENIRIVEIKGIDIIACCGTHVCSTGEIGLIKIIKTENYKGMTRIYFKCGRKALEDYEKKHDITTNLSRHYSLVEDEIIEKAKNDSNEIRRLLKDIKDLKEIISSYVAQDIISGSNSNVITKEFSKEDFEHIKMINSEILKKGKYVTILVSTTENKILFSNNLNMSLHCGKIFKESLLKFNGKGGGSDKQAQAAFKNNEDMIKFRSYLKELVDENK
ncbi:alanyl-tRNA editing protein [Clostridium lundense]|uniref:alanyl-tRNA editing protein n=1 Tax=Clostridium lundense TaxID=319475 RepID=UPI00048921DE|nr:alanine--tRNA ligase-related protein [Clostridium lundense]